VSLYQGPPKLGAEAEGQGIKGRSPTKAKTLLDFGRLVKETNLSAFLIFENAENRTYAYLRCLVKRDIAPSSPKHATDTYSHQSTLYANPHPILQRSPKPAHNYIMSDHGDTLLNKKPSCR